MSQTDPIPELEDLPPPAGAAPSAPPARRGWWRPALLVVLAIMLAWYPGGMLYLHKVDDDSSFSLELTDLPRNGSRAVAMAAALIHREVDQNGWVANHPFFLPGAALDNMPNFQEGLVSALGRFAFELSDQIGRVRGSSQTDRDLQEAAGLLQYSPTQWYFDLSTSLLPPATSDAQYRKARQALVNYNRRLSDGQAIFERRSDNLMATLDRIALDMGSSSAALDRQIIEHAGDLIDFRADDVFYAVKGQSYAYYLILRELGQDFENVLRERELAATWAQVLASLETAATMEPLVVINGAPDAWIRPSHLATLGFYVLRARTQLREITNILLK